MADTVSEVHHRVCIDLDQPEQFTDLLGRTRTVYALRIEYGLSPIAHRADVTVEYQDSAALIPPDCEIPAWMQQRIDANKPDGPAYRLR
jgi:hypothetical protein